jgi:hypothetical protein
MRSLIGTRPKNRVVILFTTKKSSRYIYNMDTSRYALVADMVDSRRAGGHRAVYRELVRALADVNRRFAASLWSPLGPTKGVDELSGVLRTPAAAFDLLCRLNLLLHPLSFRFAIGWGEAFRLAPGSGPGSLDGSAFHAAADGIERARRERLPLALSGHPPAAAAQVRAVEALATLDADLRCEWSRAEVEVARAMQDRPDANQTELARRLRRSQQAVSRAATRGHFKALERAEESIREMLDAIHSADHQSTSAAHGRS